MPNSSNQTQLINQNDLHKMTTAFASSYLYENKDHSETLMEGQFNYHYHSGGLSVHTSKVTEKQGMQSVVELPPCLSFNILFKGVIDFSLGNRRYQLGATPYAIECSAFILSKPEMMTRYFKKDMDIYKLNIFVEKSWLDARNKNSSANQQLENLFLHHGQFSSWQASGEMLDLVNRLSQHSKKENSFESYLEQEVLTIQLLSCCINELCDHLNNNENQLLSTVNYSENDFHIKEKIDEHLLGKLSLRETAQSLDISISTLQRKFKANHGMTVNNYCRQRRLALARKALIIDGLSIGEAAYLAGYNHSSNFISAFKRQFLLTPAELVKIHKLKS
jgi:AraC-like DNA-binding protein